MSNSALSVLLAVGLLPVGAAVAVERKPVPRHEDRQMYAQPERTPIQASRFYWMARPTTPAYDPPTNANGF